MLAAGAVGDISPAAEIAAALAGGTLAAGSHCLKSGSRVLINTSPEPFTNIGVSLAEDVAVIGGIWTAFHYPEVAAGFLILFVILLVWLLPKLWHAIRLLYARIARLFGREAPAEAAAAAAATGAAFKAEAAAAMTALTGPTRPAKTPRPDPWRETGRRPARAPANTIATFGHAIRVWAALIARGLTRAPIWLSS